MYMMLKWHNYISLVYIIDEENRYVKWYDQTMKKLEIEVYIVFINTKSMKWENKSDMCIKSKWFNLI